MSELPFSSWQEGAENNRDKLLVRASADMGACCSMDAQIEETVHIIRVAKKRERALSRHRKQGFQVNSAAMGHPVGERLHQRGSEKWKSTRFVADQLVKNAVLTEDDKDVLRTNSRSALSSFVPAMPGLVSTDRLQIVRTDHVPQCKQERLTLEHKESERCSSRGCHAGQVFPLLVHTLAITLRTDVDGTWQDDLRDPDDEKYQLDSRPIFESTKSVYSTKSTQSNQSDSKAHTGSFKLA
eukprot:1118356-Rhodomonas_salina.2